jgi:hypothetical protein
MRAEITGIWKKLHKELNYIRYSSENIIRVIISRKMACRGYVARMGENRSNTHNFRLET